MTAEPAGATPAYFRGPKIAQGTGRGRTYIVTDPRDQIEKRYTSVTTVIDVIAKPAIVGWGMKSVATYAVEHWRTVQAMIEEGDEIAAIDYLKGAPWRERDRSGDLGTLVHQYAEAAITGKPMPEIPPQARPYLEVAFAGFLRDHRPEYLAAEATVVNHRHGYAGTLDGIAVIEGEPWLMDSKTAAKGPYENDAMQLEAYRHAEEIYRLPDGTSEPMIEVAGTAVLKLRPEGYELFRMSDAPEIFESFVYAAAVHRYMQKVAPHNVMPWPPSDAVLHHQLEASLELEAAEAGGEAYGV